MNAEPAAGAEGDVETDGSMGVDVDAVVAELYGVRPGEFVEVRNADVATPVRPSRGPGATRRPGSRVGDEESP